MAESGRIERYPEWVHFELINWSRFCWEGSYPHPLPPRHCTSIECRYLAPSVSEENESTEPPYILANAHNAMRVQNVFIGLPETQRLVLIAEYPKRRESGRADHGTVGAARRLRIRVAEYEYALSCAGIKVMHAFVV